ncbi:sensor histidine kinase [Dactylosporangium sp. CA-139066]|uniref:sensor histidine kinase n=1 Tax=Dactylosporangium sp. CA-139066 TaxID=3239930 RepID=UPI003D8ADB0D
MPGLLRSVWDEPSPAAPPARVWRDWVLVGGFALAVVVETLARPDLPWRWFAAGVALAVLPTLLWRRTHPLPAVAAAFGACGLAPIVTGHDLGLNAFAFVLFLAYALLRWGSGREAVAGCAIIAAKVLLALLMGWMAAGDAIGAFGVLFAVSALGSAFRYRARARQRELDQVKLLERERLARDLHDTVAHHVSAMIIRAQAGLATAPSDPAAATDALRVIEAEASKALAEMRGIVRVLRTDEPAELAPAPRVADLHGLAGRHLVGPAVEVAVSGDVEDLPAPIGTAVFRLAQESVTNARRHARNATRIEVSVVADAASVRLQVSDDGESAPARATATAGGFGLAGMVERAGLVGGTCEAGPGPGRGWTVTAVLPRA